MFKLINVINSCPNDKFLDCSKQRAFPDDKIKRKFWGKWVENNVGKGESAGYQHFFPFSTMFSKAFFHRVVKSRDCVVKS